MPITRSRATKDDIFEPRPTHVIEKKKKSIYQETDVDNLETTGPRTHLFPFQLLDYIPIPKINTFDKMCKLFENIIVGFILLLSGFLTYVVGFYAVMDVFHFDPYYLCGIGFLYSIIWAFIVTLLFKYL